MKLRIPSYYKDFECIADRCKDSCCVGWEIDVDSSTYYYYQSREGAFGDRLRENMRGHSFRLKPNRRCPFLNERNLCDIVLTLGETSLCQICTEYPRFTLEYADVREKCLSISCEEVGRILFSQTEPVTFTETEEQDVMELTEDSFDPEELPDEEEWAADDFADDEYDTEEEYDDEDCEVEVEYDAEEYDGCDDYDYEAEEFHAEWLQQARDEAIRILQDRTGPVEERICRCLMFAVQVQDAMNEDDWEKIGELVRSSVSINLPAGSCDAWEERMEVLEGMEILDREWKQTFEHMKNVFEESSAEARRARTARFMEFYRSREREYENLMVYFVFRYAMKAVYDFRFLSRIQLAVLSFLTIRDMDAIRYEDQGNAFSPEDRIDNARIYSKEVEHSEDNLEYLAEEFLYRESMHAEELCRQVMFL